MNENQKQKFIVIIKNNKVQKGERIERIKSNKKKEQENKT